MWYYCYGQERRHEERKFNKGKRTTKKATTKKEAKKVEIKEDYEVKCLLIHYLKKGDVFHLKSQEVDGDMRILSMSIDNFAMTLKVKVINEKGK